VDKDEFANGDQGSQKGRITGWRFLFAVPSKY
jgi:hypothetical protein